MNTIRCFRPLTVVAGVVLAAWLALAATASTAAPVTCHARSGTQTMPLVELFTSEGCDSCPPADRWLSTQFPALGPAQPIAPSALSLAFHVDYWDRLGWRDRFASAQFTKRQYDEMSANRATFVYTPQVLVQGHDAPGWNRGLVPETLASAARRPPRAVIGLDITPGPNGLQLEANANVGDPIARKNASLWVALTDSGHVTDVAGGENRGVRLRHDHVVRSFHGPYAVDANGAVVASLFVATPAEPGSAPVVVAFVQDMKNGDVLQALSSSACRDP